MTEAVAGYIDVTSPLFGSDEGQRIASLVLSAGNSSVANSSFVLNASNGTRTQIYLVPTNSSSFSAAEEDDASLIEVSLKVPVFSPLLAAMVPYCATFDPNPPAPCPLSVQACDSPASEHSSQRFVYAPATGVIRPLWSSTTTASPNGTTSSDTQTRKRDYVVQAAQVFQEAAAMPSGSASASAVASASSSTPILSSAMPAVSSVMKAAAAAPTAPSTMAAAAAPSPSSAPASSDSGPAQSVSLVFTPVNAAAVLSVDDDASDESMPQHVRPNQPSQSAIPMTSSTMSSAPAPAQTSAAAGLPLDGSADSTSSAGQGDDLALDPMPVAQSIEGTDSEEQDPSVEAEYLQPADDESAPAPSSTMSGSASSSAPMVSLPHSLAAVPTPKA